MSETKNQPIKKFRAGAISATIWKNNGTSKEGTPVEFKSVTFERSYMDKKSGEWKKTSNLKVQDLPKAAAVLTKAYEYLVMGPQDENEIDESLVA